MTRFGRDNRGPSRRRVRSRQATHPRPTDRKARRRARNRVARRSRKMNR